MNRRMLRGQEGWEVARMTFLLLFVLIGLFGALVP